MAVRFPGDPQGRPALLRRRPVAALALAAAAPARADGCAYVTGGLVFFNDNSQQFTTMWMGLP